MRCALPMLLCSLVAAPLGAQVSASEYAARRDSLAASMAEGVSIAIGGREPAEDYLSFYPSPSFYYLTGVTEPDAVLVMVKRAAVTSATLFVQPRDPAEEVWTGTRLGPDGMTRATGLPSRTLDALDPALDSLLAAAGTLQVVGDLAGNGYATRDQQFVSALNTEHPNLRIVDANALVAKLRMRHSAAELALERKAIDITARAERDAISSIHPGVNEFEIQALIDYTFRRNGSDRPSFSVDRGLRAELHRAALQRGRPIHAGGRRRRDGHRCDRTTAMRRTSRARCR